MGKMSAQDVHIIPDKYPCPPGEYRIPHTEKGTCSKITTLTSLARRYVGAHCAKYWWGDTPVAPGLHSKCPAFGQPAAKPVLFGIDEGQDGPFFWAQAQTNSAIKIVDKAPSKVLRRLKEQLKAASGTRLSAPALYGLGGGQHSVKAYLQKYCTPIPLVSATDITQWFKAHQQESLYCQWSILRLADDKLALHLLRDWCSMRVRLEESVLHTDLMMRGAFHSIDLSYMGVPKQHFSQAALSELLQLLEQARINAGASAGAFWARRDSIWTSRGTSEDNL